MRIMVATDDSRPAVGAVRFAARLAAATGAELVVLTVGRTFPYALAGSGRLDLRLASALNDAARVSSAKALEQARREAARLGAKVRCESLRPRRIEAAAEALSRAADREHADLVVVGGRGRAVPARWALGSFANRLVHVARRPVAVVPASYRGPARRVAKILVATDGSKASAAAVRFSARLAARIPRARLSILTVSTLAADLALTGVGVVKALGLVPDLQRADRRAARALLDSAAREARRLGARVTVRYHVPRERAFAEHAVVMEAGRERADLIVVGNSGRSAVGDVILGSVAQHVVSLARRPVVLVRARRR
jgi:nucleotide-binding universal stress UspA family protein